MKEAKYLLGVLDGPKRKIDEGTAICRQALEAYGVTTDPEWLSRPPVAALDSEDRNRLRQGIGELLSLWAGVVIWKEDRRRGEPSLSRKLCGWSPRPIGPTALSVFPAPYDFNRRIWRSWPVTTPRASGCGRCR